MSRFSQFRDLVDTKLFDLPTTRSRLSRALDLFDMEKLARKRLPKFAFDYVAGSSYREEAASRNRHALANWSLRPRALQAVAEVSTAQTLFQREYSLPVGIAPTGLTSLVHGEGELAGAKAAEKQNIPFVLSTMSTYSIEDVAAAAPSGDNWFQLYLRKNRDESLALMNRARKAGYSTLVLTVDTAVPGNRLRDTRNGLSIPPKVSVRSVASAAKRPAWSLGLLKRDPPKMANFTNLDGSLSEVVAEMFDADQNWDDFDLVRNNWPGNLVVKGVLHPDDAAEFVARGADGIWTSNHGGRQLDRAIAPIETVSSMRAAIGPATPLLFDSGIMSGTDILVAIGAGADFTFLGRGYIYGLAAGGQQGVERSFEILHNEIRNSMQLLGARSLDKVTGDHFVHHHTISNTEQYIHARPTENWRMSQ